MSSKYYRAVQDSDQTWSFYYPGGRSSGWRHQGNCQREADAFKKAHRAARQRTPLDLRPHLEG